MGIVFNAANLVTTPHSFYLIQNTLSTPVNSKQLYGGDIVGFNIIWHDGGIFYPEFIKNLGTHIRDTATDQ